MNLVTEFPAVPTHFENSFMVNKNAMPAGFYGVKIDYHGMEIMNGNEVTFKTMDECKRACDQHNAVNCKMDDMDIAILYLMNTNTPEPLNR